MENADIKTNKKQIPVPKPRSIYFKKSQYENVSISKESRKDNQNFLNKSETNKIYNIRKVNSCDDLTLDIQNASTSKQKDVEGNQSLILENPRNNCVVYTNAIKSKPDDTSKKLTIMFHQIDSESNNENQSTEYDSVYIRKTHKLNNLSNTPSNTTSLITSRSSTPEPYYENQMQFINDSIFNINCESDTACALPPRKEVLDEFDPLMSKRNSTRNEVSNQLLLLQNLLQDDIYSNVFGGVELSLLSPEEISDEDNVAEEKYLPPIPKRFDSLENPNFEQFTITKDCENNVHLNQADIKKEVGTFKSDKKIQPSIEKTQTSWYLAEPVEIRNTTSDLIYDEQAPPPYSEDVKSSLQKRVASFNDNISFNIHGRSEINKMISNFRNKINVLKRKPSIKNFPIPENSTKFKIITRSKLSNTMVRHEGFLIRFPAGTIEDIFKELQNRKAILKNNTFLAYQESELKNLKESIPMQDISTIQCVSNNKITENSTHYYCFEITTVVPKVLPQQKFLNPNINENIWEKGNFKAQRTMHLYGISKESERDLWMQKLLQSLTNVFPNNFTCQFYRAGWCYLKKSITTEWSGAWILLTKKNRKLLAFVENELTLEKLDLRKARCIVMKEIDNSIEKLCIEPGPILMIDCPPFSLYLVMGCPRETKIWKHIIREVSYNNGAGLNEQQLTKHNIPVIIDKCINFIYIHGSMSEGIYRKSGSENLIQKLLYEFRLNAFSVEITKTDYNEHDVANVLKRFLRNLPQRLLGQLSESFTSVSQLKSSNDKITSYKELLARLSSIEFMTMKKLINHLAFMETQKLSNKMTLENLGVIWGPTLLQTKNGCDLEYNQLEVQVIKDLMVNSKKLFPLSKDEINKEKSMLHYLKKYYAASETLNDLTVKQSGDLKVWVALDLDSTYTQNDEHNSICITLHPGKTAGDVCKEVSLKIKKDDTELCLFEIIFNNCLERPIHTNEKLFQTVMRWSYWSEEDRKNNCLVVKYSKYLIKMSRTIEIMKNFSLKKALHYADNKTKAFKVYEIELNGSSLTINKIAKSGNITMKIFELKNFSIYLGSERKLSFNWALTLIENNQILSLKNAETTFAGHVISGNNKDDQIVVFSNIWKNIYGNIKS